MYLFYGYFIINKIGIIIGITKYYIGITQGRKLITNYKILQQFNIITITEIELEGFNRFLEVTRITMVVLYYVML